MLWNIYQISFRVVTLGTQHKFSDEPIKHVLQLVRLVGSVDDVTIVFGIKLGLSAEFTTKKLGRVCGGEEKQHMRPPWPSKKNKKKLGDFALVIIDFEERYRYFSLKEDVKH